MTLLAHAVDGPADAPPLVLLHAILTHGALWQPQLPAWAGPFRVLRIDLPGHGRSPVAAGATGFPALADAVAAVLDHHRIERAAVLGLSFGGMVAQALALAHPQRVRALVLAHTGARTEPPVREVWERRLQALHQDGLDAQVAPTLERWFTRGFAEASPLTLAWVAGQIRATPAVGYEAAVRAIQSLDHLDRLAGVAAPALVIAGEHDSAVPPAAAAAIAQRLPNARLAVLPGCAHLGNVEQPVRFAETVGAFLRDLPAA